MSLLLLSSTTGVNKGAEREHQHEKDGKMTDHQLTVEKRVNDQTLELVAQVAQMTAKEALNFVDERVAKEVEMHQAFLAKGSDEIQERRQKANDSTIQFMKQRLALLRELKQEQVGMFSTDDGVCETKEPSGSGESKDG